VINELSLEEYLYSVVPSEMPSSYGVEALKVQAVCARSYAVSHMNNGKLSKYGAQVDDSTDYQVYNSTPETENSISAVNATYGQVLKNGDDIANTYFYATSCGSTTGAEIWGGTSLPYIKGKILTKKETDIDLTDNQQFSEFIKNDYETYDSGNSWYRWSINMTSKQLTNILDNNLNKTYNTNPDNVLTLVDNEYKSQNVNSIGSVTDMYINKRGEGGIIEELIIRGTNGTVKIIKQSAIRNLLNPNGISIVKNDGTSVDTFTSLPSAFFTVDKENGEFKFYGGGYGHGAGMSQTAVKNMVDDGMNYEEILEFFYYECRVEKM
jgi:stage II sporulation protein D